MTTPTRIEWTEHSWNPTVGCTKISPGCKHCYAEALAIRLHAMGASGYENRFKLTLLSNRLRDPLIRKKPTIYFVNSMSDLFHEKVPFEYIDQVFEVIRQTPQHTYQLLTKRANRMKTYFSTRSVPSNVWLGVSVENRKHGLPRIDALREVAARVRFLSIEPLLENLGSVNLTDIHWVIVGGESGPKARVMKAEWAHGVFEECKKQNVPFFFKQWGAWGADGKRRSKSRNGRLFNGKTWDEMPLGLGLGAEIP